MEDEEEPKYNNTSLNTNLSSQDVNNNNNNHHHNYNQNQNQSHINSNNNNNNNDTELSSNIDVPNTSTKKRRKRRRKKKKKKRGTNTTAGAGGGDSVETDEPLSLQRPCLAVPDTPPGWSPDLSREAETPEEYLQRVRWEAQHQCPPVTVASHINPAAYDDNRTEHRLLARFRRQTRHLYPDNDGDGNDGVRDDSRKVNNDNDDNNMNNHTHGHDHPSSSLSTSGIHTSDRHLRDYRPRPAWTAAFLRDFAAKRRWMCTAAHVYRHQPVDTDRSLPSRGDWEAWRKYCWGDADHGVDSTAPSMAVLLALEYQTVNQLFEQQVRWIVEDNPLLFSEPPARRKVPDHNNNNNDNDNDDNNDNMDVHTGGNDNDNDNASDNNRDVEEEEEETGVSDIVRSSLSNEETQKEHYDNNNDEDNITNNTDGDETMHPIDINDQQKNIHTHNNSHDDGGGGGVTSSGRNMFAWLFGLLLRVERPLQPSVSAALADLVKWCTRKRSGIVRSTAVREESRRDGTAHLNMVLAMTLYFGQASPHHV